MNQIPNKLMPQTKLTRKQRVGLLIAAVVVLLGLLTATVFRSNVASFFRWVAYSQSDTSFSHNAQASSLFLGMGDDLLIATQSQIQVVSPTGTAKLKQSVSMTSPALNASGDYAVVYDVGGKELKVVKGDTLLHELTLPDEESILCATVNEKGWVAVTSKASGYKGVVTVYNRDFESVLTIRLSSRYISDAVVTPDSRGVYLISPGQADGAFENTLLYYTISSREEPTRTISLGSNVVLSIRSAGRCWIIGDESLMILDSSGVITASYDYKDQYLKMGSLQGDNYAALYLSPSSSGSTGTLVTVGSGRPDPGHGGPGEDHRRADHQRHLHHGPEPDLLHHLPQPAGHPQPGRLRRWERGPGQQRRREPVLLLQRHHHRRQAAGGGHHPGHDPDRPGRRRRCRRRRRSQRQRGRHGRPQRRRCRQRRRPDR